MSNIKLFSSKGRNGTRRRAQPRTHSESQRELRHETQRETQRETQNRSQPESRTKSPPKPKGKTALKAVVIVSLVILLGSLTLLISLGIYVNSIDTIFPNVWVDGIKLSGLTVEEATRMLINMGYHESDVEEQVADFSATVVFPDGESFSITSDEVSFALGSENEVLTQEEAANAAATKAFEFGRGGVVFESGFTYIQSLFGVTDLHVGSGDIIDEALEDDDMRLEVDRHVRDIAREHTKKFNEALVSDAYRIENDTIIVTKGSSIAAANEDAVFEIARDTLLTAMSEQSHLSVEYSPSSAEVVDIDLELLYSTVNREPVSSVYDPETYSATESFDGVTFDISVARSLLDSAAGGAEVVIPLLSTPPEMTQEELSSMLFRDVLGERTTNVAGTSNRRSNVALAAELINGTVLNPGQLFSFNETVGNRTSARGFKPAGAFVSGRLVDEIGGGICQTSSTLYVSVLKSDLEVVSRREHGLTVSYLPLGQDATVAWGQIDFKFKNSSDYPIRIEIEMEENSQITARIIGTKLDDGYIIIESRHIGSTQYGIEEREDDTLEPGQRVVYHDGNTGHVAETFKLYYDADDNLIREEFIVRSTYRMQNRIILVGPPLETPDTPPDAPTDTPTETPPPVVTPDTPTDTPTDVTPDVPSDVPSDVPPEVPTDNQPGDSDSGADHGPP